VLKERKNSMIMEDDRTPEQEEKGKMEKTIKASDVLALPHEALPGIHSDDDDTAADCWAAVHLMARGASTAEAGLPDTLYATSSRWTGRRRIVANKIIVRGHKHANATNRPKEIANL
jgi:hypothetical protein